MRAYACESIVALPHVSGVQILGAEFRIRVLSLNSGSMELLICQQQIGGTV